MVYLLCLQIDFFLPFGVEFRRRFVAVALGVPDRGDRQHADDGEGEDHDVGAAPAVVVGHVAESHARDQRAGVTEDTQDAVGAGRRLLGGLVGRRDAQQCLRAVDEEGDQREGNGQYPCRGRVGDEPEDRRGDDGAEHTEHAGAVGAAAEDMVRGPACDDHAQIAAHELEDGSHDARHGDRYALRTGQEHHAPVEHREADDVDEEVGDGQHPDDRVAEYHAAQERLVVGGVRRGLLLLPDGRRCGLRFQLGQSDRRRLVAQREIERTCADERNGRRNEEAETPCAVVEVVDEKRPQHENQTGADRVRHVPDRHLGRQFVGRDPVGHQRRDGRHAHALEIAVQQQDRTHDDRQRRDVFAAAGRARDEQGHFVAEPEPDVDERAERQAQRHEFAGAHPIGDESVDEPRNAVDDAVEGQEDSELRLGDAEGSLDARHGGVEVLAHEIVECVTDHRDDDGAGLPVLEFFRLFGCHHSV